MDHRVLTRRALEAFAWMLCYGALWGLFAEGAWLAGLPWVVLAVAVRLALGASTAPLAWSALPGLLAFFLRHMVAGAWDVGRRALHPRRPLSPGWVSYRLQWPDGPGAPLLAALVGLLPGTLASHVAGGRMCLHVLDRAQPWARTVAAFEARLVRLLGEGRT